MAKFEQKATPEDIAAVKAANLATCELAGQPEKPVWMQEFAGGAIQFIHTWITVAQQLEWNEKYLQAAQKNPASAEHFLNTRILESCVLWPKGFSPSNIQEMAKYPAGVIQGLVTAILQRSGIGVPALPELLVTQPAEPELPSDEEFAELEASNRFGVFAKPFFVGSYNEEIDGYDAVQTRYYLYTLVDEKTWREAQGKNDEQAAVDVIVNTCVVWPKQIDWMSEPAGYKDAMYTAIMSMTGFQPDTAEQSQEL